MTKEFRKAEIVYIYNGHVAIMSLSDVMSTCFNTRRAWMVVDEKGLYVTLRQEPRMALVAPSVPYGGDMLRLDAPDMLPLQVSKYLSPRTSPVRDVRYDVIYMMSYGIITYMKGSHSLITRGFPDELSSATEDRGSFPVHINMKCIGLSIYFTAYTVKIRR